MVGFAVMVGRQRAWLILDVSYNETSAGFTLVIWPIAISIFFDADWPHGA